MFLFIDSGILIVYAATHMMTNPISEAYPPAAIVLGIRPEKYKVK